MKTTGLFATLIILAGAHVLQAQPYQTGHTQITFTDPARAGRNIQAEIYYPAATAGTGVPCAAGAFPVIVFGHGFVMSWDAYQNFWDDLVPKGYIIAFPKTESSFSPSHGEFGKDLAFLVTKLQSESATNAASVFYTHITGKSAVMGHSMGGGSAFLAAENNTAITTMISFAAANTTPSAVSAAQQVTVPSLVFSGQNDCVAPATAHQSVMYDSLAAACKTFISIKGGAHCEFANYNFNCSFGQTTCSPQPTITGAEQKDVVSDFLNPWLEFYLKEDPAAITVFNDSLTASLRITYLQDCPLSATGIHPDEMPANFSVYPNPASDVVSVKLNVRATAKIMLSVTDLLGNTLLQKEISAQAGTVISQLDLSEMPKGIYFITLSKEASRYMQKLIRQ